MSLHSTIDSQALAGRPPVIMGAWPRLLDAEKAAMYLDISERFFLDCVKTNTLPAPRRIGKRVLWDRHVLDRFVDVMFDIAAGAPEEVDEYEDI